MTHDQIFLGLALMAKDASNYLKFFKKEVPSSVSKSFHGSKKSLMSYLMVKYPVLEYRRIVQCNPNSSRTGEPMCLLKLSVQIDGTVVSFHTPSHNFNPFKNIPYTTDKVKILCGKIPPDNIPMIITSIGDVIELTNKFNLILTLLSNAQADRHQGVMDKLEQCVVGYDPHRTINQAA